MSTLTTRLGLYKPAADGSELVNVVTDLNNNLDSLDAKVGVFACTSGTRPASPYDGQMIRETDTGKVYIRNATAGAWQQVLFNTAQFANSIDVVGSLKSTTQHEVVSPGVVGDHAFRSKLSADATHRFIAQVGGLMLWGDGTTQDTNLYRSGANVLKTDDSFQVGAALTVAGSSTLADASLSGNLNLGSARFRPLLSSTGTVANTTTETVIATLNIPANDAVVGAVYKVRVCALASVAGTPTLTLRSRIGGVAGNLLTTSTGIVITAASNGTNHHWFGELYYVVVSTGGAGTGRGFLLVQEAMSLGGAAPFTGLVNKADGGTATAVHDTTASKDLVLTAQWSAASVSNTTTAYMADVKRVA